MIKMSKLIKQQNQEIRKETGMVKKESINERLKRFSNSPILLITKIFFFSK